MNQVFDSARFLRLLRAHWAESWKTYAWFFGVSAIVNGIVLAMVLQSAGHQYSELQQSTQSTWYGFGLLVTGLVFATRYFEGFSGHGSTLIQLMRPASAFEKWCLAVLLVCILFPLAYTAVYACMNYPAVVYAKAHYVMPTNTNRAIPIFQIYLPFTSLHVDPGPDVSVFGSELILASVFLTVWAMCMSGRVFFKRAAVLKTWLVAFGLLLIGICIDTAGKTWFLLDETSLGQPHSTFDSWDMALVWVMLAGVPFLLWIGLFFHIKEREVS